MLCKPWISILRALAMLCLANVASAYSECQAHLVEIWSGSGGEILLVFDTVPPVFVFGPTSVTDVAQKNAIAVALSAYAMNSPVSVRYQADGIPCSSGPSRTDFGGIWIQR